MKKNIFLYLIAALTFVTACKKDEPVKLTPAVATSKVANITDVSAVVSGFIVASGDGLSERGVCWNIQPSPTIANSKYAIPATVTTAAFDAKLAGLTRQTTYYARAYATSTAGTTIYGEEFSVVTTASLPTVSTTAVTGQSVTMDKGVVEVSGGSISDFGGVGIAVTERGVCLSTSANPTVADDKRASGDATSVFTNTVDNLKGNTTYYLRAYAKNSIGVAYGAQVSFTTPPAYPIVKSTAAVKPYGTTTATTGGEVTYDGGNGGLTVGVCYGTTANPTVSGTKTVDGTGAGAFVTNLTGLAKNTTYYIRAYATNGVGTVYGAQVTFKTLGDPVTYYLPGNYAAASGYPSDWSPLTSATIVSPATDPANCEGFVNIAVPNSQFVLVTDGSWNGKYAASASNGLTSGTLTAGAGNNIADITTPGYYLIKFNIVSNVWSYTSTTWGIIGDATAGGWNSQANMTYDPVAKTFSITAALKAGTFKFRGTSDWGVNYGHSAGDPVGGLSTGGDNIPVAADGTYLITLDLSHPNAYTYTAVKQ